MFYSIVVAEEGSKVSSINVDANLALAVFIFIFTLTMVGLWIRSTTSRRDKRIIEHKPIWHDFPKEETTEKQEETKED